MLKALKTLQKAIARSAAQANLLLPQLPQQPLRATPVRKGNFNLRLARRTARCVMQANSQARPQQILLLVKDAQLENHKPVQGTQTATTVRPAGSSQVPLPPAVSSVMQANIKIQRHKQLAFRAQQGHFLPLQLQAVSHAQQASRTATATPQLHAWRAIRELTLPLGPPPA
jgi:hypothetical protein